MHNIPTMSHCLQSSMNIVTELVVNEFVIESVMLLEILCLLQGSIVLAEDPWPYLQIYPSVNETNSQIPLYIAVVLSSDGDGFESIGALPGIQIALDYINNEPSLLPGYSLHYTFLDSEVVLI